MLAQAAPGSELDRVAPAIFKRLGANDQLAACLERTPMLMDADYAEWLKRVEQG
ncbi:MAG TPA: hypothetical protein VIK01_06440 [Polyangiaceae bacterium]